MKRLNSGAIVLAAIIVVGSLIATHVIAEIIEPSPISGNFVLDISGQEQVEPFTDQGSAISLDLKGVGLTTADGNGNLSGNATLTFLFPAAPGTSGPVNGFATAAASCGGTLAGTVAEPGNGTAQIQLQFTPPAAANPTDLSAQDGCVPTAFTLSCVDIYPEGIAYPLLASGGTSGSSDPTPAPTPTPKKKRRRKADGSLIPIDPWPPFYLSSATRLKCVATSVSSAAVSITGALIKVDLEQTAPASVTVPPPVSVPPPVMGSSPVPYSYPTPPIPQATPGANG